MSKYNIKNLSLSNTIHIDTNKINEEKMDNYNYNLHYNYMVSESDEIKYSKDYIKKLKTLKDKNNNK